MLTAGCIAKNTSLPDDFSLSFAWDTGTLPPKHRYEYVITIGPGAQGELDFVPGYRSPEEENRWIARFEFSDDEIERLYASLQDTGVLRSKWNTERGLAGGSATSLIITAFGKEYQVPSTHKLKESDREMVEGELDVIRAYVPRSIWDEMDERQQQYEEEYSD